MNSAEILGLLANEHDPAFRMETASELAATIVMARARCRIRNAPHRRPGADDLSEPVSPDAFNVWNVSVAALRRLVFPVSTCTVRAVFCREARSTERQKRPKNRGFLAFTRHRKKVRPTLGGGPAAREPGLGTGRGGDVTGNAELLVRCQCAVAVALDEFGSPSDTHTLGSACDWRLTKR